jgi:CubicO group peptidase (beta-lactamase class C family)
MIVAALATHSLMPAGAGSGCGDGGGSPEEEVAQQIEQRFAGDRSGACVIAAVIEPDASGQLRAAKATRCAGARQQALDGDVALEIGSITKTMTGMLLGQLAAEGKLGLDDALARYAPPGVQVPSYGGAPIRIKHLATHTSGLPSIPSGLALGDPENPYAQLREDELWSALGRAELTRAPGTQWEYSNFAVMLLSSLVAREGGGRFEEVVRARLFTPLGMTQSYLQTAPAGVRAARGHKVGGAETSAWDFSAATGGVGGVRATMDDMIRYAKAQLGEGDPAVVAMARRSHQRVELGAARRDGDPEMGLGWIRGVLDGRTVLLHDGGTGGFSSILLVDPDRRRAVVVLADTQLATVGGVTELGLHLLDEALPLDGPRLPAVPAPSLVAALVGRYRLGEALEVRLERRGAALWAILATGGAPLELELAYDSHGDFYPRDGSLDGLLTPVVGADGRQTFAWVSEGVPMPAERQ